MSENTNIGPSSRTQNNNAITYVTLVICIIFLMFPFITTYQARKGSGSTIQMGLISDVCEGAFDSSSRSLVFREDTTYNIFRYSIYICLALLVIAYVLFLVSVSSLINGNQRSYWTLIQGCSLCTNVAVIAYLVAMLDFTFEVDRVKTTSFYYDSSVSMMPAPFLYISLAGSFFVIIISNIITCTFCW